MGSSDEPILAQGQVFVGKYRIDREIGRGGYGAVYLAEDVRLKRRVAIKVLQPRHATDKKVLARFQFEVQASTRLTHPSIVQIFDTGIAPDGTLYIAIEFVEGQTLHALIKPLHAKGQRIGVTKAPQVCFQIARTMSFAHGKKIIHRDLKPQNLMLTPDEDVPGGERVKVLDFGVAKQTSVTPGEEGDIEGATSTGDQIPGTYVFMAPEQFGTYSGITGHEEKMDCYALGVIAYQLLAGRVPLYKEDPVQMMGQALAIDPPPLLEIDPSIPSAFAELVHALLAKTPQERPTMAQVRDRTGNLLGIG